jgi:F1F0 ATPase subunit 2
MMTEMLTLVLAGVAGGALGGIFFGGLWWTVRKGISSRQPALLFFASLLLRTIIVLTGFHFVTDGHWNRLLVCLLGFVIARFIVMRLTDSPAGHHQSPAREADHAPES